MSIICARSSVWALTINKESYKYEKHIYILVCIFNSLETEQNIGIVKTVENSYIYLKGTLREMSIMLSQKG